MGTIPACFTLKRITHFFYLSLSLSISLNICDICNFSYSLLTRNTSFPSNFNKVTHRFKIILSIYLLSNKLENYARETYVLYQKYTSRIVEYTSPLFVVAHPPKTLKTEWSWRGRDYVYPPSPGGKAVSRERDPRTHPPPFTWYHELFAPRRRPGFSYVLHRPRCKLL